MSERDLRAVAQYLETRDLNRDVTHIDAKWERIASAAEIIAIVKARPRGANALATERAPQVPEGWKLVPVKPTKEMLGAGWKHNDFNPMTDDIVAATYRAMLAAAPEGEANG